MPPVAPRAWDFAQAGLAICRKTKNEIEADRIDDMIFVPSLAVEDKEW
jgi:hypothetical protein